MAVGLLCVASAAPMAANGAARPGHDGAAERWPVAPARDTPVGERELSRLRSKARRAGRAVEVQQLRRGRSRTFVAGDGAFERRFSRRGAPSAELSWGGPGTLARLTRGATSLELGVDGATVTDRAPARLGRPAFDGLSASYRAAGVDLKVRAAGEGFVQRLVIGRRPDGPLELRLPLRLRGLDARMAGGGVVELVDGRDRVVASGSGGRAAGARRDVLTGEPRRTARVITRLVDEGEGQALAVVPDPSFLSDPRVRYPVTVDFGARFDPCMGGTGGVYECDPPGAPASVAATAYNEKVAVTWAAPLSGGAPTSYTVTARRAGDGSVVARRTVAAGYSPGAAFTFRDGIANGEGYRAEVVASNEHGDGPVSESSTVRPAAVPWSQSDTLGGANPSQPAVTCRSSWGVDCGTGNFSWSRTDLRVPGRGVALELTSTYNSQSPYSLPSRGRRWVTNYDMRVRRAGSARIVHQENGSTVYFFDDGSGGWHPEGGAQATLTNNPDGGYTFRRTRALTSFVFDDRGVLVEQADRNGYETTLSYLPGTTILSRVTDPAGRSLTFAYDAIQRLSRVSDPAGRAVSFSYDDDRRLTRMTDPAGGVTSFAYSPDSLWHLTRITSPDANADGSGNVVTNAYDGEDLSSQTGGPADRQMSYVYSSESPAPGEPATSTTTTTDPEGNVVVARHANYMLTSLTRGSGSPEAATSSFEHDPVAMEVSATTDPRGKVWRSAWDARGNLLRRTDPLGHVTSWTYDQSNRPLRETDPLGHVTSWAYDANSNPTSRSRALVGSGQTQRTTYAYDSARPGDLIRRTDPVGKAWTYAYDSEGNRVSETDPLGDRASFGFDAVGRLTSATGPRGNAPGAEPADYTTRYRYDPLDDLLSVTDPLGHRTSFGYDPNQNLTSRTDANGRRTSYAYDRFDQLVEVRRPDGSTLGTSYDRAGNVVGQTDPLGETTTYGYDALNRVTSEIDPLGRGRGYRWDRAGNLAAVLDAAGRTTTHTWDAAGRRSAILYGDAGTPDVSFGYDAADRRVSMSDGSGSSSYAYDSLDRLTAHTDGAGRRVTYGYDLADRTTRIGYPAALGGGGGTVTRGHDAAGRLTSVGDWKGNVTRFSYDRDSNLVERLYPNGVSATRAWDRAGRLTEIADSSPAAGAFLQLDYTYDAAGLVRSEGAKAFAYDPADRLESQSADPAADYDYDPADNVTRASSQGGDDSQLSYDAAHQLKAMSTAATTGDATTSYTYDPNGNRTAATVGSPDPPPTTHSAPAGGAALASAAAQVDQTYGYDQADRLVSHRTSVGPRTTYAYDGDGLRTAKTTGQASPRRYTWDIAGGLPLIIGDGQSAYLTGPDGLPLAQIDATGTVRYHHHDRLGSTRALTDRTGTVTATASFDPYGNPAAGTASLLTPFGYAGQYTDAESGLQYLRARYYDPRTQSFLTRDPLAPLTRSPYAYADANPTNYTDPTGLTCAATGQGGGPGPGGVGPAPGAATGSASPAGPIAAAVAAGIAGAAGILIAEATDDDEPDDLPEGASPGAPGARKPVTGSPRDASGNIIRGAGGGKGPSLSDQEAQAVRDYEAGGGFDRGAFKRAEKKLKEQEKFEGTRGSRAKKDRK